VAYAGTEDLARVLRLQGITGAQGTALDTALEAAWYEINSECNGSGTVEFGTPYPALAVEVNLDRAVEHWKQNQSPFGIVGLGADTIPMAVARDSWERHAQKLAPLRDWSKAGIA
jgi:hypothetical protein